MVKRRSYLLHIVVLSVITSLYAAVEGPLDRLFHDADAQRREKLIKDARDNINKSEERKSQEEENAQKIQKLIDERQGSPDDLKRWELEARRARISIAQAERERQGYEAIIDFGTDDPTKKNTASQRYENAEKERKTFEDAIKELDAQLKSSFESSGGRSSADIIKKKNELINLTNKLQQKIDTDRKTFNKNISDRVAREKNFDAQIKIITDEYKRIDAERLDLEKDKKSLEEALKLQVSYEILKKFYESIQSRLILLDEQEVFLSSRALELRQGRLSIFTDIVNAFTAWWEKVLNKSTSLGSIQNTPEFQKAQQLTTMKDSISGEVDTIVQDINTLNNSIADLEDIYNTTIKDKTISAEDKKSILDTLSLAISSIQKTLITRSSAEKLQNTVETLQKRRDGIQELNGELGVLKRRYLEPEEQQKFHSVFEKMYDYYSSSKIMGEHGFGPDQVYDALFTDKVIKRLGLSEILSNGKPDPKKVTLDHIKQAYDLAKDLQFFSGDTVAWTAARNASFLLRNRPDRELYDAFLQDMDVLKKNNFAIKDIAKLRGQELENSVLQNMIVLHNDMTAKILNGSQGAVKKLELSTQDYNLITQVNDINQDIIFTESHENLIQVQKALKTLTALDNRLQTLAKQIDTYVRGSQNIDIDIGLGG